MRAFHSLHTSAAAILLAAISTSTAAVASNDVVTERYGDARLGANLDESTLTTTNVNAATFGKLWSYTVSGSVYAQPLYVRNVAIPGQGTHNVVYIVTMNDWVYGFDADSGSTTPLLSLDLTTEVPLSRPNNMTEIGVPSDNIIGNVGIESTPHIDLASNTMYLVARTHEPTACIPPVPGPNPTPENLFCQRLHALDIGTLQEKPNSPVILGGSVPGTSAGSSGGTLTFNPRIAHQRASLAYANGRIFIAWSGHSDQFNYHGWVMVHDATTLQQTKIWSSSPTGSTSFNGGGIWMAGRAPTVDVDGNVYYMVGNGPYDVSQGLNDPTSSFGESFIKFGSTADTPLLDWFTPNEVDSLNGSDSDLGGSGPLLIPGTDLVVGGGKSGKFFVTHTGDMGHLGVGTGNTNIVQAFSNGGQQIKGGTVYWNRAGGVGPWMYVWADGHTTLKAYRFNADFGTGTTAVPAFDTTPVDQSTQLSNNGSAGGVMTLSANGSTPGSGIVWSSMAYSGSDPNSGIHPGVLRALDADHLTTELWNSEISHGVDSLGNWPKFSPPTVINGRVYMGSFPIDGIGTTGVSTYGLLPIADFGINATPRNPGIHPGDSVTYTITTASIDAFSGSVHLTVSGLPAGATASFTGNDFTTPGSATLTVQTDAGLPIDPSSLVITATSGSVTHTRTVGLFATSATAGDGTISIDFVGTGTPMLETETAGVVAVPNWNSLVAATGTSVALVDETGTANGATITWNAPGQWKPGIADTAGDFHMMDGYLNATDTPASVTVSGLPVDPSGYYVTVYSDGDNRNEMLTTRYSIAGSGTPASSIEAIDPASTNFNGSFVRADNSAGNYVVFFVSGGNFTLTATPVDSSGSGAKAPLNAIQIVHGDRLFADGFEGSGAR